DALEQTHFATRHEDTEALDFPFELDAGIFEHFAANLLTEIFEVVAGRLPHVDHEVAVKRRHLRAAYDEPAASRFVNQLPGRMSVGILERRAAGLLADRLNRLAVIAHRIHIGTD